MGRHDFTHFANIGEANYNPLKTITRLDVLADEHGYVFQVEGSGFLYKMVRPDLHCVPACIIAPLAAICSLQAIHGLHPRNA